MTPQNKPQKPQNRKSAKRRLTAQLWAAVVLILVGSALLICGFIIPPMGEIHPSVLIAFGEILTFVGAIFGIDYHYKDRFLHSRL